MDVWGHSSLHKEKDSSQSVQMPNADHSYFNIRKGMFSHLHNFWNKHGLQGLHLLLENSKDLSACRVAHIFRGKLYSKLSLREVHFQFYGHKFLFMAIH